MLWVPKMYAKVVKASSTSGSLFFQCNCFVAPAGDDIFAILGSDRILYTSIDSEIGKEYAVRVVKKTAWNVIKVKVGRIKGSARYSIPKQFAKQLGISKGDYLLLLELEEGLHVIPVKHAIEKIGKFKEPLF